jgi:hypothetical protein
LIFVFSGSSLSCKIIKQVFVKPIVYSNITNT